MNMNDMNSHISDILDIQGSRIELGNKLNAFLTNKYSKYLYYRKIFMNVALALKFQEFNIR